MRALIFIGSFFLLSNCGGENISGDEDLTKAALDRIMLDERTGEKALTAETVEIKGHKAILKNGRFEMMGIGYDFKSMTFARSTQGTEIPYFKDFEMHDVSFTLDWEELKTALNLDELLNEAMADSNLEIATDYTITLGYTAAKDMNEVGGALMAFRGFGEAYTAIPESLADEVFQAGEMSLSDLDVKFGFEMGEGGETVQINLKMAIDETITKGMKGGFIDYTKMDKFKLEYEVPKSSAVPMGGSLVMKLDSMEAEDILSVDTFKVLNFVNTSITEQDFDLQTYMAVIKGDKPSLFDPGFGKARLKGLSYGIAGLDMVVPDLTMNVTRNKENDLIRFQMEESQIRIKANPSAGMAGVAMAVPLGMLGKAEGLEFLGALDIRHDPETDTTDFEVYTSELVDFYNFSMTGKYEGLGNLMMKFEELYGQMAEIEDDPDLIEPIMMEAVSKLALHDTEITLRDDGGFEKVIMIASMSGEVPPAAELRALGAAELRKAANDESIMAEAPAAFLTKEFLENTADFIAEEGGTYKLRIEPKEPLRVAPFINGEIEDPESYFSEMTFEDWGITNEVSP